MCVCVCSNIFLEGGNFISNLACNPLYTPLHPLPSTQQVINKCVLVRSWLAASTLVPLAQTVPRHAAFHDKLAFLAAFHSAGENFIARPLEKKNSERAILPLGNSERNRSSIERNPRGHLDKIHPCVYAFSFSKIKEFPTWANTDYLLYDTYVNI